MLKPWTLAQARLVEVAAGRAPADMVIRGGQWVNVHTREVLPGHDIAIADGRVAGVFSVALETTQTVTAIATLALGVAGVAAGCGRRRRRTGRG